MQNKTKAAATLLLLAVTFLFLLSACSDDTGQTEPAAKNAKLKVVASFYPMYDFATKVGGDKIEALNLVPAGTEPHDWEPAPSDIKNLENASVFIYSGADMEHWTDSVLASLTNKNLVVCQASDSLKLLEGKKNHSVDPHVWLSPENAKVEMENIKNALTKADPENTDYYQANYDKYAAEFDKLNQEYKDALSPLPNKDIVVSHEAFGYLCAAYGLNQKGIEGLSPASEPSPDRMAEIIDFVKKNNVKYIFFEDLVSPKVAQAVAEATGAECISLNPLEGLTDEQIAAGDDYFSVMRKNLDVLRTALK